ncbi:MAG TPA: universal stress protein [Nitrososphaera sp.]|nr:universal stress protein [Nitrososphaera sp.]
MTRNAKKILVPYDGSKPSENAVKQAVELANDFSGHSEIILLHVVQEVVLPPAMFESPRFRSKITGDEITTAGLAKELSLQMKEAAVKMLSEKRQQIMEKAQDRVKVRTKVLIGYPSDKIEEYSREENIDLIIIGNVGLSGASKFKALGSVSRTVSERAICPVIIVH